MAAAAEEEETFLIFLCPLLVYLEVSIFLCPHRTSPWTALQLL